MEKFEQILSSIIVVGGLIYSLKYSNKFNVAISSLLLIAILLTICAIEISSFNQLIFILASLFTIIYSIFIRNLDKKSRIALLVFTVPFIIIPIVNILHSPYKNELTFFYSISIGVFIYAFLEKNNFKNELGFMISYFLYALFRFYYLFASNS